MSAGDPTEPLSDHDLLVLLAQAEDTVERLRSELTRRRRAGGVPEDDVDLGHYLAQATVSWQAVRDFLRSAIEENSRPSRRGVQGAPRGQR